MVGTALKKYAEAHDLRCDGGYVYGKVKNRPVALVDGTGVKLLQIYLCPPFRGDDAILNLQAKKILEDCDKEYRLIRQNAVTVGHGRAVVAFQDGIGAMARIERYIDVIVPRLDAMDSGCDLCAGCGRPLGEDAKYVLLDDYILPVHGDCIDEMSNALAPEQKPRRGSLVKGSLGAALGAIIGAIPWALVYMLGYVAGIAGLLIGFLANFFYGKFGGRQGRARLAIVAVALILGVLLGQASGVTGTILQSYHDKGGFEAVGLTRSQFVRCCWEQMFLPNQSESLGRMYDRMMENLPAEEQNLLATRDEFIQSAWDAGYDTYQMELRAELLSNLGMGVGLGLLGCLSLFSKLKQETRRKTIRKLK